MFYVYNSLIVIAASPHNLDHQILQSWTMAKRNRQNQLLYPFAYEQGGKKLKCHVDDGLVL